VLEKNFRSKELREKGTVSRLIFTTGGRNENRLLLLGLATKKGFSNHLSFFQQY
jgi:hypothetical protein